MEHNNTPEYTDSFDLAIEERDTLSVDALRRQRAIQRRKEEELTAKMQAAGIPISTKNGKLIGSSTNNKTRRRGGNHRRSWKG